MTLAQMSRDEVMERLGQLGWKPAANVAYTHLEKRSTLHGLEEKVTKPEKNDNPNVCAGLSQKNKTELRDVCKVLSIPLSGHKTKPQLTRSKRYKQSENHVDRQPWILDDTEEDVRVGVCPRQTILRVGGLDTRGGRCYSVATAEEVRVARGAVTGNVYEGDEFTTTVVAQSTNEVGPRGRTGRPDETSGTSASDGSTTEDDSEVQCNLKTMNEQQRTMLRKGGKQLCMGEIDQLTTNEDGHTDLAEIGNVGQSEPLSTCELLRGRTLRISRDTRCDMLKREGSSGAFGLLRHD